MFVVFNLCVGLRCLLFNVGFSCQFQVIGGGGDIKGLIVTLLMHHHHRAIDEEAKEEREEAGCILLDV